MGESKELQMLREGRNIPTEDTAMLDIQQQNEVDMERFNCGREFFKKNLASCIMAMLFSLVCGLSVSRLLDVLVATGKSSKPSSSLRRYLSTFRHVLKWHYGNVWDKSSDAAASIAQVRHMHTSARTLMAHKNQADDGKSDMRVSQYDMALVQCAFISVVVYPLSVGVHCTKSELEDYVYFWRWIGCLLGIQDRFNVCIGGHDYAVRCCKAVEDDILFPALENPPIQYYPMAYAFTDGLNMYPYFRSFGPFSPLSIMEHVYNTTGRSNPMNLSLIDKLRLIVMKIFLILMYYIPAYTRWLNGIIEVDFRCANLT